MGTFTRIFCVGVIVADLGAIVYLGGNYLTTGEIFPSHENETHAIAMAEEAATPKVEIAAADPMENFVPDAEKGRKVSGKCKACHTFDNGGKNSTGPNLWGVVDRMAASHEGFAYSPAFQAKADMPWTEENLNKFLENPRKFVDGTKMAFGGIKKPQDRANLIEWLKTLR